MSIDRKEEVKRSIAYCCRIYDNKTKGLNDPEIIKGKDYTRALADCRDGDIYLAFRGTQPQNAYTWYKNLKIITVDYDKGSIHKGFYELYEVIQPLIVEYLKKKPFNRLILSGHSLGGALGLLSALNLIKEELVAKDKLLLYTFGQPRVGTKNFKDYANEILPIDQYRIYYTKNVINIDDEIYHQPDKIFRGFHHAGKPRALKTKLPRALPDLHDYKTYRSLVNDHKGPW